MADINEFEYLSVMGLDFMQPISDLVDKLLEQGPTVANDVQTTRGHNQYSVSIVVLAVLMLESCLIRTKYIMRSPCNQRPLDFYQTTFPDALDSDEVLELFVLRDALVHNHIWEFKIAEDFDEPDTDWQVLSASLAEGFGDRKLEKVLDKRTRRSKSLGLNLNPTRVALEDAKIVLKTVSQILLFLEGKSRSYVYSSRARVLFKGNNVRFHDMVKAL